MQPSEFCGARIKPGSGCAFTRVCWIARVRTTFGGNVSSGCV
jgi:hypothetical protein